MVLTSPVLSKLVTETLSIDQSDPVFLSGEKLKQLNFSCS
jgi:hypothetical protein